MAILGIDGEIFLCFVPRMTKSLSTYVDLLLFLTFGFHHQMP